MDSMDLEREKGITILAKNTSVRYKGNAAPEGGDVQHHRHARPRRLRRRGGARTRDGRRRRPAGRRVRGPAAPDPLRAAQGAAEHLPVILVINKVDRHDARIGEVVDETYELFLDLDATDEQIDFPIVYTSAKAGRASLTRPEDGGMPEEEDLEPLFDPPRDRAARPGSTRRCPCRPTSPTSTRRPTWVALPCAGSITARSARVSRSRGSSTTVRSSAPRSSSS